MNALIVTIMQPAYLPWLGYFARIAASDIFILLDHVAIDLNSKTKFANRNRIRTAHGWTWLTVPIRTKGKSAGLNHDRVEINNENAWRRRHWHAIELNYGRAPFFMTHRRELREIYEQPWDLLCDLNAAITNYLLTAFSIRTIMRSSALMSVTSRKEDLILDLCREVGATHYISGPFGREYLDAECFRAVGIDLVFHDYLHPTYGQCYPGFEPYMSAIDLLFNEGPNSLAILSDLPVRQKS